METFKYMDIKHDMEYVELLNQQIEQLFNELQQFNLNFDNYEKN